MKILIFFPDSHIPKPIASCLSMHRRWAANTMTLLFNEFFSKRDILYHFATGQDLFEVAELAINGEYDGFIHLHTTSSEQERECLRNLSNQIPTVAFTSGWREEGMPYVGLDNKEAIKMIIKHLESEGFERLAYCGPDTTNSVTAREREGTFLDEMANRGISVPPEYVLNIKLNREEINSPIDKNVMNALDTMFSNKQTGPDAIVCFSDEYAIDVLEYCQIRGISVPDTLGVSGINGWFREGTLPITLSTVSYNLQLTIRTTCLYLLELIKGTPSRGLKKEGSWILIPPLLMTGNTAIKRSKAMDETSLRFLRQVHKFTQENLHLLDPVDTIAERCEIGRAHFRRKFAALNGENYVHYLQTVRLERAAELLSGTDEPISDISNSCGFKSLSWFHNLFMKRYGCTPKMYRMKKEL